MDSNQSPDDDNHPDGRSSPSAAPPSDDHGNGAPPQEPTVYFLAIVSPCVLKRARKKSTPKPETKPRNKSKEKSCGVSASKSKNEDKREDEEDTAKDEDNASKIMLELSAPVLAGWTVSAEMDYGGTKICFCERTIPDVETCPSIVELCAGGLSKAFVQSLRRKHRSTLDKAHIVTVTFRNPAGEHYSFDVAVEFIEQKYRYQEDWFNYGTFCKLNDSGEPYTTDVASGGPAPSIHEAASSAPSSPSFASSCSPASTVSAVSEPSSPQARNIVSSTRPPTPDYPLAPCRPDDSDEADHAAKRVKRSDNAGGDVDLDCAGSSAGMALDASGPSFTTSVSGSATAFVQAQDQRIITTTTSSSLSSISSWHGPCPGGDEPASSFGMAPPPMLVESSSSNAASGGVGTFAVASSSSPIPNTFGPSAVKAGLAHSFDMDVEHGTLSPSGDEAGFVSVGMALDQGHDVINDPIIHELLDRLFRNLDESVVDALLLDLQHAIEADIMEHQRGPPVAPPMRSGLDANPEDAIDNDQDSAPSTPQLEDSN